MKFQTSTGLAMAIASIGLIAVLGSQTEAQSPSESSPLKIVIGELSKIEGGELSHDSRGH